MAQGDGVAGQIARHGQIGIAVTILVAPLVEACAAVVFQTVVWTFVVCTLVVAVIAYTVGLMLDLCVQPGA